MTFSSVPQPFLRTRLTWLAYFMLAFIAINQSMLGPLMPFLRGELNLNYTQGGLIPAALAVGLIISGIAGDWLARRLNRRVVFWGGSIGLVACVILLGLSYRFEWVLVAALGMGFGSSLTQVMIQAFLSDQHGDRRAIALTEANVAASFTATLTPFIVGSLPRLGLAWRMIPMFPFLVLILLAIFFYRVAIPDNAPTQIDSASGKTHLPHSFWLYWMVLFLVVASEMVIAVWATDFLASVAGLGRSNAALAFTAFPAAMLTGRFLGSRLAGHWSSQMLLLLALLLTLIGFPVFWLSRLPTVNILGLFITGLGIANLYPLTLSIAVGVAAGQSNRASARASLAVGTALLSAPLFLGWLSDRIGIQNAYGIVLVFAAAALVIVVNAHLLVRRRTASPLG
jgi:fucose permease